MQEHKSTLRQNSMKSTSVGVAPARKHNTLNNTSSTSIAHHTCWMTCVKHGLDPQNGIFKEEWCDVRMTNIRVPPEVVATDSNDPIRQQAMKRFPTYVPQATICSP